MKSLLISSPICFRIPTISPLEGASCPPWRKSNSSLRSESSMSCRELIRLLKACAVLVCKNDADMPASMAATAFVSAWMLALCPAESLAYSAASFSRMLVASAMLALAASRSVWCCAKSSFVCANFASFSSISDAISGTSPSYAAIDFSRSPLPVLHEHINLSCISASFSPSSCTFVCIAVNMLTTLRIGFALFCVPSCMCAAWAAGAARRNTRTAAAKDFMTSIRLDLCEDG
mmetsp:Transcript_46085/g.81112  ORF Transcript_46085/g.81112 Transcript_46085/m.81112 type:complete len:233 (-) Transcript_46085:26-724(-)